MYLIVNFTSSALARSLEEAARIHGEGTTLAVLENLCKAHVVRSESTTQGFFLKCLYRNQNNEFAYPKRQVLVLHDLLYKPMNKGKRYLPPHPAELPPSAPHDVGDDWAAFTELPLQETKDAKLSTVGQACSDEISSMPVSYHTAENACWNARVPALKRDPNYSCLNSTGRVGPTKHTSSTEWNVERELQDELENACQGDCASNSALTETNFSNSEDPTENIDDSDANSSSPSADGDDCVKLTKSEMAVLLDEIRSEVRAALNKSDTGDMDMHESTSNTKK